MTNHQKQLLDDTCWVYVQQDDENTYTVGITYDEDFFLQQVAEKHPIVFRRKFDDTLSAAGYRMVLKGLSIKKLKGIIRKYSETNTINEVLCENNEPDRHALRKKGKEN